MNRIEHQSIPHVVTVGLIDSLVKQIEETPLPRIREAAVRQLYSIGVTVRHISEALLKDLEAGDAILSQKSHEEQNEAPETQMWLEWLAMYELAETQLKRIADAIPDLNGEAA